MSPAYRTSFLVLFLTLSISVAIPRAQRATGNTSTNQTAVDVTIHVKPDGNDRNNGLSPRKAVKTLTRGVALARPSLARGKATKISISPGLYREGNLRIDGDKIGGAAMSTLLIIEGTQKGKVIISGAEAKGWEPSTWKALDPEKLVYEHAWPFDWGESGLPRGEDPDWYSKHLRHREMILHNQRLLTQCTRYAATADSCPVPDGFYVDEDADKIYIRLRQPLSKSDRFEVPVRDVLLVVEPKENFVLRNLNFIHSNAYVWQDDIWGRAVACTPKGGNVLIENCSFDWNNAGGADMTAANGATWRGCSFSNNGWKGLGMAAVDNVLLESCRADSNAWRQNWSHHYGLDAAGIKVCLSNRVTFQDVGSVDNWGRAEGIWLDFDNKNMTFDGCTVPTAILLEANPGPLTLERCSAGHMRVVGCKDVVFDSCTMASPMEVSEQNLRRVRGWTAINESFGIYRCTMRIGDEAIDAALPDTLWVRFLRSLESDRNTWVYDGPRFRSPRCFMSESTRRITFQQWQDMGKDGRSVFVEPKVQ